MQNEFGAFLERLRGKMSLRKAAERSGLSHTYIRDLELGINRSTKTPIRPTPETIKQLAEAYNYNYEELMQRAGYLETKNESEYSLPESEIDRIIKETEQHYKVNLRDDPVVLAAMKQMIELLAQAQAKKEHDN